MTPAKFNARIVGAWEHPTRLAPDKSLAQLHADCALGAIRDAGLQVEDIDGYFCAGDSPGMGPMGIAEYMNLRLRHAESTEFGGSSYMAHVAQAARAIDAGLCEVALITLAGKPRSAKLATGSANAALPLDRPDRDFEQPYRPDTPTGYALCAARHMHDWGTTSEQLAWIKVAASHHAQHNEHAMLRKVVTVDEVLASPMVASPLHRLDCCVVSDGGGALIVASAAVAKRLKRPSIRILGAGIALKNTNGGDVDLSYTASRESGRLAFAQAGLSPRDIQYASIYDSFTITVLMQLEDLGFCKPGQGGGFVANGNLISGRGELPFNTDGGGLCSNHPANRGGMTKIIEAVRQLRGEAHPAVQVPGCRIALAHGTGGQLGNRHASGTLVLGRED